MPVRTNVGKIAAAIEAGIRANDAIDRGPLVSFNVESHKETFADWQLMDAPDDIFIAGVHKWGNPELKVSQ